MLAFPEDAEAGFLERFDGCTMVDAGELRHDLSWAAEGSDGDFDFPNVGVLEGFGDGLQVFPNGVLDVFEGLLLRLSLRPAPGQRRAGDAETFFRLLQPH